MRQFLSENAENFDLYQVSYGEVRDLGDRLVAFGTVSARGRESGIEVTTPTAMVATFRDGKMVRAEASVRGPKPSKPWGCRSSEFIRPRRRPRADKPLANSPV